MERTEILDMMGELRLFGMRAAYDETLATALKRQHEPQRFVGDLLRAEISEKQARSIKYQITASRLPLAKDFDDFVFKGTPINEALVRDLAGGGFIAQQRNAVLVGGTGTGKTHLAIATREAASAQGRAAASSPPSISSTSSRPRRAPGGKAASPILSPAWTSWSSTSSATCRSPRPAASSSSTSSAGSTSAPRSSSPPISPSANGRACSATQK